MSSGSSLSVVIPAYNEASLIGGTLERVRTALPCAKAIVVDGGSTDETTALAVQCGATVLGAPRSRGIQCHAGAMCATSNWLLFLHADTLLPINAEHVIEKFSANSSAHIATFRLRFSGSHRILNTLAWVNGRVDSVFTRFGDQGILVRRSFYDTIGGFPPWPLFEDVAFLQRARALSRIHWLPACIGTSPRRFDQRGVFRQRLLNAELMLRYLAGASPFELATRYQSRAAPQAQRGHAANPAGATTSL